MVEGLPFGLRRNPVCRDSSKVITAAVVAFFGHSLHLATTRRACSRSEVLKNSFGTPLAYSQPCASGESF